MKKADKLKRVELAVAVGMFAFYAWNLNALRQGYLTLPLAGKLGVATLDIAYCLLMVYGFLKGVEECL